MPELAEVKIMAEYINSVTKNLKFSTIRKSKVTKNKSVTKNPFNDKFIIQAESRGKELKLLLMSFNLQTKTMTVSMGMTGNWVLVNSHDIPKHAHLIFDATNGTSLCLVDVRRFAKWKWSDFSNKRGPDPIKEHKKFIKHVLSHASKSKVFHKPIFEILMDQKYFNGIGNYLRAEILYRANVNPFLPANLALLTKPEILNLCKQIPEEAYVIGGGELKDWENPYNRGYGRGRINKRMKTEIPHDFRDWLKCYQKMESIEDSKGRKFWYDKKYQKFCNIYKNKINKSHEEA